jgi:hypothetical protein
MIVPGVRRFLPALVGMAVSACASSPPPPPALQPSALAAAPGPSDLSPAPSGAGPMRNVDEAKDRVAALVSAGDGDGLFKLFDPAMQKDVPAADTSALVQRILMAKGSWHKVTRELGPNDAAHGVWRVLADRGTWRLEIALDEAGLIAFMTITEPHRVAPPVARSDVPLSLPFRGEWLVVWGGDRKEVNHHVGVPDQRRAADLAIEGPDHRTYRGDGRSNADYLVYGQEVLAVADGTVEAVVDGVPENVPHEENHYVIPGNYVLVRHRPALYSGYMHLQPGSIRVKPGAQVRRGTVLGLVGNSGHSTEPHLHLQLQDGPDGNKAWGVEAVFERVVVTRGGRTETVPSYTFLRGDRIREP